jgi:hypothetical protein
MLVLLALGHLTSMRQAKGTLRSCSTTFRDDMHAAWSKRTWQIGFGELLKVDRSTRVACDSWTLPHGLRQARRANPGLPDPSTERESHQRTSGFLNVFYLASSTRLGIMPSGVAQ